MYSSVLILILKANPKPSLKIRTASAISWNYLGLFRDYGLDHIFLGLFCFSRFKAETLSICLKKNFVKPFVKILTHSAHSDNFYFHFFLSVV